jgi:arylsulfatase A-like enzyme
MKFEKNKKFYFLLISLLVLIFISGCIKEWETVDKTGYKCPDCNVILITIDALRPDHLGCYGYERNTSPNIDELAREGVLFENAIIQAPYTYTSIASIFTSIYNNNVKIEIEKDKDKVNFIISGKITNPTLAEVLKRNNYLTAGFAANPWLRSEAGFDKGFDTYRFFWNDDAPFLNNLASEWLDKNHNSPFFLYLHYMDPHLPYYPPAPYNILYVNDSFYNTSLGNIPKIIEDNGVGGILSYGVLGNHMEIAYYISQYDGEISYVDHYIGKLMNKLDALNLTNNTLIIITADHGEGLGEHNLYFTHDIFLYDFLIKVPLIIKCPQCGLKAKVVNAQVRSIDIMPTILDILGIKINHSVDGVSLLPLIKGANISLEAYSQTGLIRSIRTNEWKYIHNFGNNSGELYNLKKDPKETKNVVNEEPEIAENLKLKLSRWMSKAWEKLSEQKGFGIFNITQTCRFTSILELGENQINMSKLLFLSR